MPCKRMFQKRKQHAQRAGEPWRTRSLFKKMKGEVSGAEIQCVRQKDRRWERQIEVRLDHIALCKHGNGFVF